MKKANKSKKSKDELLTALKAAYKAIDEKMGFDVVMLDISEVSIVADYFLISSARNPNHLSSLSEAAEEALRKVGVPLHHSEGVASSRWILHDFGGIVIHLFCEEDRENYKLELLWGEAKTVLPEEF
jgi:ribosome-associated protein